MFDHLDFLDSRYVDIVEAAIADGRASCNVQAVHAVDDIDTILYGECLATLQGPDGNVYGAGDFIPALEALREAPLIDRYMVRFVLDLLEDDPRAVLGCNLSAENFIDRTSWDAIAGQIQARSELAPRLILEVTETREFCELALSSRMIDNIRNLGCRVALDDFGTGYASPSLLRLIDFDIVKIDQSFLDTVRPSVRGGSSLAHLVNFASCYAPTLVVEGVETEIQAEQAALAGATHLQGYLLSCPTPIKAPGCNVSGRHLT